MRVYLSNRGNPDFQENPRLPLHSTDSDVWADVGSIAEASSACRRYIDWNHLGGGNWTGGEVREMGAVVGRVSYNGKVWPPGDWAPGMAPLYVPES